MRRALPILLAAAILGGCATPPPAEEPADAKSADSGFFPLSWGDDHFDLFPLVWWRYERSFVFFPVWWWRRDRYLTLFPLWWSNGRQKLLLPLYYQDENTLVTFPLYAEVRHIDSLTDWFGPYGRHRCACETENADWCIPFYYRDRDGWQTPLFGWSRNDRSYWFFPGFFYRERADGSYRASLLWRVFRNEYDASRRSREVDVLFIPVWR